MGKIKKDSLGDRQKQYEAVQEHYLVPKMPFIIRIDGKAFHTYTRGFVKPFDNVMGEVMKRTMQSLCEDIPGAVFGYTQSDEITIVCKYTDRIKSQAWFGGRIEKINSIAASKATKYFNKVFTQKVAEIEKEYYKAYLEVTRVQCKYGGASDEYQKALENFQKIDLPTLRQISKYKRVAGDAEFDSRVFNIPEWDCINNVIWRQQDAIRNSVEMVGHANFSAKELHKVTCEGIKDKLRLEKNIDWENDFTTYQKRGACTYKQPEINVIKGRQVTRNIWKVDENMPVIHESSTTREWFSCVTGLIEE